MEQGTLDLARLQTVPVKELQDLLSTSEVERDAIEEELNIFVYNHLSELEQLYLAADDDSRQLCQSLIPLQDHFEVLRSFESTCARMSALNKELKQMTAAHKEQERLDTIEKTLDQVAKDQSSSMFSSALEILENLLNGLSAAESESLSPSSINSLYSRALELRANLMSRVEEVWEQEYWIKDGGMLITRSVALMEAIKVLVATAQLKRHMKRTTERLYTHLVVPILTQGLRTLQTVTEFTTGSSGSSNLEAIEELLDFLVRDMPAEYTLELRYHLVPRMVEFIKQDYAPESLPAQIQASARIQALTKGLLKLEMRMKSLNLLSALEFTDVVKSMPSLWLEKRRAVVLDECRRHILSWAGTTEMIEQNENVTQAALLAPAGDVPETGGDQAIEAVYKVDQEVDDWGATDWDVDDAEPAKENDDEEDAWGLDADTIEIPPAKEMSKSVINKSANAESIAVASANTVLLSTKYSISTIPKALLALIQQCKEDSDTLASAANDSPIASQHSTLLSLESEILCLYRSLVPLVVARTGYPRMTIYNDCIYLASQTSHPQEPTTTSSPNHHTTPNLREFGERFYAAEIHEKRDQILTLLSPTNGLLDTTVPSHFDLCRSCIRQVLDLLTRTQERYESQLGRTTMLTALGTLTESALSTFTASVEAMTDISAAESTALASLGDQLSSAESLFRDPADHEAPVLAAMWCPSWFRFRLLLDILEAKLDDILALWDDGHLVDYEPGEVADLVRALFSDSPKRRKAIQHLLQHI